MSNSDDELARRLARAVIDGLTEDAKTLAKAYLLVVDARPRLSPRTTTRYVPHANSCPADDGYGACNCRGDYSDFDL